MEPKEGLQTSLWLSRDMTNESWIFKNQLWLLPGGHEARLEADSGQEAVSEEQRRYGGWTGVEKWREVSHNPQVAWKELGQQLDVAGREGYPYGNCRGREIPGRLKQK